MRAYLQATPILQSKNASPAFFAFVVLITVMWLLSSGCQPRNSLVNNQGKLEAVAPIQRPPEVQRLEQDLVSLLGYHDEEALRLAQTVQHRTNCLSKRYGITSSSIFHNLLVNLGVKDRGLCCHWTEDLLQTLNDLELKKFRLIWAVSNYGSFREHSSVAVVPVKQSFEYGIVLDPWRNAGKLYWSKIGLDSYKWLPHPAYNGTIGNIKCENGLKK